MKTKLKKVIDVKNSISTTILGKEIPLELIEEYKKKSKRKFRNRIYSLDMIMYGMLYQTMSEDKSEQNTVLHIVEYYKQIKQDYENQKEKVLNRKKKKIKHGRKGRPKSELPKIQKSKLKDISLNTASYDEAKQRMPLELVKEIFEYGAKDFKAGVDKNEKAWNGLSVYATDGTTFKTQDTEQLRKYFDAPAGKIPPPVPMGRMQGLINIYGGGVVALAIDGYGSSEGKMMKDMYRKIPGGTVLLADDLYSSYGHINYSLQNNIYMITQGKHRRKDKVVKVNSKGDCIVEWKSNARPSWYVENDHLPDTLQIRRIRFTNPSNPRKKITLYTTLSDSRKYRAFDIIALYLKRWDIEISFYQIKIILMMEYLRGKTIEAVMKEIYAHIILYNILRKILKESCESESGTFSPLGNQIQICTTVAKNQSQYVDKLGRSYYKKNL